MKTTQRLHPLVVAFLIYGCAVLQPGADPVVVNAERTTAIAVDTFDTFFKVERENQVWIKTNAPQIHTYANYARKHAPDWIQTARSLTVTYKTNRTPENKASLQTAVAVLTTAINQIKLYQLQITAH